MAARFHTNMPFPLMLVLGLLAIGFIVFLLPVIIIFLLISAIFGGNPLSGRIFNSFRRRPVQHDNEPDSNMVECEVISSKTLDEDGNEIKTS